MSNKVRNLSLYENLPEGGAKNLCRSTIAYLREKSNLKRYSDQKYSEHNLLKYLFEILFVIPRKHFEIAKRFNRSDSDLLVTYQSWVTRSPNLIRYINKPILYICHEPPREYYDIKHIKNQSIKDRIINLIRYPVKLNDLMNIRNAKQITFIANSKHSKKYIDNIYNVNSMVVYPGIDLHKFKKMKIKKVNQLISVGAINKLKGFDFLVRVVGLIPKSIRPNLVIIGDDTDSQYIDKLYKISKQVEVVLTIKTKLSDKDLIKEYNKSLGFLFAPINEPFGIVVQEAISCGLPVFVYKYGGGYAEQTTNDNGLIFDNLFEKEWARKITVSLQNEIWCSKIQKHNIRYSMEHFSQQTMNDKLWSIIQKIT